MRILILGGTRFVGRALTTAALEAGHTVALFHRGQSNSDLHADRVEHILGDRTSDLGRAAGRPWDWIVDTCAYRPQEVRAALDVLGAHAGGYVLISTISVYTRDSEALDESRPLLPAASEQVVEVNAETYGPLKVACEMETSRSGAPRTLIIRPGLIAGPHDTTDRFTSWISRFAERDHVLVPADGHAPLQQIDARDLAQFVVSAMESDRNGVVHTVGTSTTFSATIEAVRTIVNPVAEAVPIDAETMERFHLEPWSDFPLYAGSGREAGALFRLDGSQAAAWGLKLRPLEDTVRDTHAWWLAERKGTPMKAGLSPERESEVLAAMRSGKD